MNNANNARDWSVNVALESEHIDADLTSPDGHDLAPDDFELSSGPYKNSRK